MKNGMATPNLNDRAREAGSIRARFGALACAGSVLLLTASLAAAATLNKDQAKRMYDRIAGVAASDATLTSMVGMDATQAALNIVTKDPAFYNNTIRNLAMPWTNRDQTVFAPLNDYVATVVGMVRDDVPFNTLLSADLVYIADATATSTYSLPAYSPANNDLYQQMDDNGVDLKAHLVSSTQSALTGIPATATAGVMTTRGAAAAFFINGTNRAMFRFTVMNHLCSDLQTIMDTTRPPDRIRQDVTRSPGGDSGLFLNNCIGCHSGMDPMAQAFAYYNFNNTDATTADSVGKIVYTAGQVQPKYFINNTNFPQGYVTPDDHWDNRWRGGVNSLMGWDPIQTGSGQGAKSLGQELAGSQAFASCQVTRVFKYVCFRAPSNVADRTQVATMVASFKSSNYSLRQVFADAAVYCMGN
ncbi:MAG: hypothetical protein QOI88_1009 [Gammaproteobacteria bacterium]|jgi:hypothetical protein|nr:hypothetical protein [Gammaproteobacteria bacterium]